MRGCVLSGWCVCVSIGNVLSDLGAMGSHFNSWDRSSCEGLHSTSFRELAPWEADDLLGVRSWGTHLELCLGNPLQYWPGAPPSFDAVLPFLGPA